jgi:predicted ArsR family transcriptional regulator
MGNSRSFRRGLAANKQTRQARPRYPYGGPSLGTVRRWMRELEDAGHVERSVEHTGKPGRPAHLWTLTAEGKRYAKEHNRTAAQLTDMITKAIHDRKYGQVPHLLRHLAMKDPDQAKRIVKSLEALVPQEART